SSGGLVTANYTVSYDATKLTFLGAALGQVLGDAGWTAFTADASTPGLVRIQSSTPNKVYPATATVGGPLADLNFQIIPGSIGTSDLVVSSVFLQVAASPSGFPMATIPASGLITFVGTPTTTTVSTSNPTPTYGNLVTLTALVAPNS